jgi:hypothetical protein
MHEQEKGRSGNSVLLYQPTGLDFASKYLMYSFWCMHILDPQKRTLAIISKNQITKNLSDSIAANRRVQHEKAFQQ